MAIKIKKKDRSEEPDEAAEEVESVAPAAQLSGDADPFLRASWDSATWVEENRGVVVAAVLVIFAAVVGGYFGLEYLESQKVEASSSLTPAFEDYNTLLKGSQEMEAIASNPDLEPPEKTFENDEQRWQGVYDAATKALGSHPNADVATAAKLAKAAAALKLGKNEESVKLYEEYLADPKVPSMKPAALQGLATAYAASEKWDEAAGTLDKLVEIDEQYASGVRYQKARMMERAGKTDKAKELYHELLDTDPNHPEKSDIERRLANM